MDVRTIIAVVLSVVIIVGSMVVQNVFFSKNDEAVDAGSYEGERESDVQSDTGTTSDRVTSDQVTSDRDSSDRTSSDRIVADVVSTAEAREIVKETDLYRITFTTRGGTITSIQLKEFQNADGSPVEMVLAGDTDRYPFSIHFGGIQSPPDEGVYQYREVDFNKWEFIKTYRSPSGVPFTLKKAYYFPHGEYLMEFKIVIENSVNSNLDLDFNDFAYTVEFGPQIGPPFEKLDNRNEYRQFHYYADGKRKKVKLSGGVGVLDQWVTWATMVGKYFAVICVTDKTQYRITFDTRPIGGMPDRASMFISRPVYQTSKYSDKLSFYIGPKKRDILTRYNDAAKNIYGLYDQHFEEAITTSIWIGWLASILKFFLELFYRLIPNYGVAIILLTILVKILFYPLTRKSYESTGKMQGLSEKVNQIKETYKGKPERMNQEIAALYKKEGVNPLGGCMPLLLQFPIFIALFNLLSNHFELRGAVFISPWIVDLSSPESILDFAPFEIPIVGWHDVRLLPFIMLGTTFLQSKFTQAPSSQGSQMKMMTYAMPIFFFFILYDMPSGLVLYWTMQNILSIFQQLLISRAKKKGDDGSDEKPKPFKRR